MAEIVQKTGMGNYDHRLVEKKWYERWEHEGSFAASARQKVKARCKVLSGGICQDCIDFSTCKNRKKPLRTPYCIVMPPPNVTGSLHLGHALDETLQDILIRWRRMQGFDALWLPGTDHAGIATQARVEEELAKEGLTRHDLGREAFLSKVWAWKEKYGSRITEQLRLLGASCDWQRERFTMDEGCSRAVREVFVSLFNEGLIYRGNYMINWCTKCHTTISDIEVEHEEEDGWLTHILYPLVDGTGHIVVATTRPETMLGDTAVAVHPDDIRYRHLIGRRVLLPLVNKEIPVIADAYVDPAFGSGAVKITPAHDPNDFEIGQRHNLDYVEVIDKEARMTQDAGVYAGLERYAAREAVVRDLASQGLLLRQDEYRHNVGRCYRCSTVVEPLVSEQWFVKIAPLAERAAQAVREGKVEFVPERFSRIFLNWLDDLRDWCISRQLWWGHRIPVWYCQECNQVVCRVEDPIECPSCGSKSLVQDEDVLDTWFSSALWPFSTLGWPERTVDLERFYPTSVLVTGRDILFFWVARMIFMGLKCMDEVPFGQVFIHGLVRDAEGRKMSKSLGNGVDPVEVIDQYGADSLRFMMITNNAPGNDLRFNWDRVESARNFANKIWNAARFVIMNLEGRELGPAGLQELPDKWILSRLKCVGEETTKFLNEYQLGEAARVLYDFIWGELCDWYIEIAKIRLYGTDEFRRRMAQQVLLKVFRDTLKLLHPFMPFLTEEIWSHLPDAPGSIMLQPWPVYPARRDEGSEEAMLQLMEVIRSVRNIRGEMRVPPKKRVTVYLVAEDSSTRKALNAGRELIKKLAQAHPVHVVGSTAKVPSPTASAVVKGAKIFVPVAGLIDFDRERERLDKELQAVSRELSRSRQKLANQDFLGRAPGEVVARERMRSEELAVKEGALRERLAALG